MCVLWSVKVRGGSGTLSAGLKLISSSVVPARGVSASGAATVLAFADEVPAGAGSELAAEPVHARLEAARVGTFIAGRRVVCTQ